MDNPVTVQIAKPNVFPELSKEAAKFRNEYDQYMHVVTCRQLPQWLLRAECDYKHEVKKRHYLLKPTDNELHGRFFRHRRRHASRGDPRIRKKILCFGHFLNVVHLLRCKKPNRTYCHHYSFGQTIDQFPLCNGDCIDYRTKLFELYKFNHSTCEQKHCRFYKTKEEDDNEYPSFQTCLDYTPTIDIQL